MHFREDIARKELELHCLPENGSGGDQPNVLDSTRYRQSARTCSLLQPAGFGPAPGFAAEDQDSLPPEIARAYAALVKAPPPRPVASFDQRWSMWGAGFGGSNTTNGNSATGSNNVSVQTYGGAVGDVRNARFNFI